MASPIYLDFKTSVCILWCLLHAFTHSTTSTTLRSPLPTDVSYRELEELDVTCPSLDNCQENRTEDSLKQFNCLCGSECAKLDACCIDSPFRPGSPVNSFLQCRPIYGRKDEKRGSLVEKDYVFMVDSCKPQCNGEVEIENLCLSDSEETNDPFLAVPVTSMETKVTYKNYFCYVCNEENDCELPTFWNVELQSNVSSIQIPNINYNNRSKSWFIIDPTGYTDKKTPFFFEVPSLVKPFLHYCRPDVISTCSDSWSDDVIKAKCVAYTAIVMFDENLSGKVSENFDTKIYKNPHCAICNFQTIENYFCSDTPRSMLPSGNNDKRVRQRANLYTLNDKPICGNNMVYDSFSKKCRAAKCSSKNSDGVTLEDLQSLDAVCHRQNCKNNRKNENLKNNNCLCGPDCVKLDVCCVDSEYRTSVPSPEKNLKCLKVYGNGVDYVFMKETCRDDWRGEALVRNLCLSSPETENDPILAIPTTSASTNTTYKNYFCFLCNENETDYRVIPTLWNVVLKSKSGEIKAESLSMLNYNKTLKSWTVEGSNLTDVSTVLKVSLTMDIPETSPLVHHCKPIVSECHDSWTDSVIQKKCLSYMSVIASYKVVIDPILGNVMDTIKYRNLHCAFCNYDNLQDFFCPDIGSMGRVPVQSSGVDSNAFVRLLSVRGDNHCGFGEVYDGKANKCRTPRCASRNYVSNNGKCSPRNEDKPLNQQQTN